MVYPEEAEERALLTVTELIAPYRLLPLYFYDAVLHLQRIEAVVDILSLDLALVLENTEPLLRCMGPANLFMLV
jgi:hypothetical protein